MFNQSRDTDRQKYRSYYCHYYPLPKYCCYYYFCFMAALCNRAGDIYFYPVVCSSSSFFFPHLISAVAGWISTILLHMVWP